MTMTRRRKHIITINISLTIRVNWSHDNSILNLVCLKVFTSWRELAVIGWGLRLHTIIYNKPFLRMQGPCTHSSIMII